MLDVTNNGIKRSHLAKGLSSTISPVEEDYYCKTIVKIINEYTK